MKVMAGRASQMMIRVPILGRAVWDKYTCTFDFVFVGLNDVLILGIVS